MVEAGALGDGARELVLVIGPPFTSSRSRACPLPWRASTASRPLALDEAQVDDTSVRKRPEPPRRDGVVTPFPFLDRLAFGGAPVCVWRIHVLAMALAAARITSRGPSVPVQRSNDAAPWATRISRPSTTRTPRVLPHRGVRAAGPVDQVDHEASGTQVIGRDGKLLERGHSGSARPDGRAVDQEVGAPARSTARTPSRRPAPARAPGCGSRRDVDRARLAQRPGGGARGCRRRRARAPCARPGGSASAASSPARPCCRRRSRRRSKVSVFAAPIAARRVASVVGERERGLLVRDRHVGAAEARPRAARAPSPRRAPAAAAGAGSASRRARAPRARRCASPASGCARPASRRRPGSASDGLTGSPPSASGCAAHVALELRLGGGEACAPVAAGLAT